MSVYIKGMEMPKNCCQCPVNMEVCKRGYMYLLEHPELYDNRAEDCPLVPVPEHGRLIDANPLTYVMGMDEHFSPLEAIYLMGLVTDAPTIIPAD